MTFCIFWVLTILWFILMTYLSHQDGEHTGKASYELAEKLKFLNDDVSMLSGRLRRLAHVVVFSVFTILLGITLWLGRYPFWPLGFTAAWSYIDEATKPLIQGRHFSWFDVGLNLLGAAIGYGVVAMLMVFVE